MEAQLAAGKGRGLCIRVLARVRAGFELGLRLDLGMQR